MRNLIFFSIAICSHFNSCMDILVLYEYQNSASPARHNLPYAQTLHDVKMKRIHYANPDSPFTCPCDVPF